MTKLLSLEVSNVFPFKTASLDLDYEGITVIKGLNKDDGPKASNAAGKSRLVSTIADLVLDETPTGKDEKIKGQKKKKRKQQIRVGLQKGKHTYQITKTVGKGKTYEIVKDGKSTNVRTVKYSNQKIRQLFGLNTEDQFYTRFYIDGTIPHPLITGSASRRQDYVVDLFELKDIDNIRKLLNAELRLIEKKGVEYRTIKKTLDELREDLLPREERDGMQDKLDQLKRMQDRLSDELKSSQHISQLLTFERQNKQLLDRYRSFKFVGESLTEDVRIVRKKIGKMHADREANEEWAYYDKHYAEWSDSWAPVKKELKKLGCDVNDVRKKAKEVERAEFALKTLGEGKKAGTEPEAIEEPKWKAEDCSIQVHKFREELKHAKGFKHGKCPMCGSKVKARPIEEIEADLAKWVKRINKCEDYDRYSKRYADWKEKRKAEREHASKVQELELTKKKLGKHAWVATLLEDVGDKPSPPIIDRPEKKFDADGLEKLQNRLETLKQFQDVYDTIQDVNALTDEQRAKAEKAERHVQKLNEIMAETSDLTTKIAKQDEVLRRLRGLKSQAVDLKEQCRDEKLLKALVGAYSTSGLKKFMIQRYSKLLEDQVNKYRRMFFAENYEFEFRYDTGLKVIVHRSYGKRVETSDVRKLSGAEKRFFTLLLIVATNTMLPVGKRLNALILDEPESQMGPPAIERFVKTLTVLQKLVPHIIVVTPKTDMDIPDSRGFTVVKHNGVSNLVRDPARRTATKQ